MVGGGGGGRVLHRRPTKKNQQQGKTNKKPRKNTQCAKHWRRLDQTGPWLGGPWTGNATDRLGHEALKGPDLPGPGSAARMCRVRGCPSGHPSGSTSPVPWEKKIPSLWPPGTFSKVENAATLPQLGTTAPCGEMFDGMTPMKSPTAKEGNGRKNSSGLPGTSWECLRTLPKENPCGRLPAPQPLARKNTAIGHWKRIPRGDATERASPKMDPS